MTAPAQLTASEIIRILGGPTALSRAPELSAQRSAVSNWPSDGIPAKHWPALLRVATRLGVREITLDALERHTRAADAA